MAFLLSAIGGLFVSYQINSALDSTFNTVNKIIYGDPEKRAAEFAKEQEERHKENIERRKELHKKHNEIRAKYGIPQKEYND